MYKKHEDKDSLYHAECHEPKMDSVSLPCLCLYCGLQRFVKFYWYDTRTTKRLLEDLDVERLQIKYVYGQVHATTLRRLRNDYSLPKADDAEATVSVQVQSDNKLYTPTTLNIGRDDELLSKLKVL